MPRCSVGASVFDAPISAVGSTQLNFHQHWQLRQSASGLSAITRQQKELLESVALPEPSARPLW